MAKKSARPIYKKFKGYYIEKKDLFGLICGWNNRTNFLLVKITGNVPGFKNMNPDELEIPDPNDRNNPKGYGIVTETDMINSLSIIL